MRYFNLQERREVKKDSWVLKKKKKTVKTNVNIELTALIYGLENLKVLSHEFQCFTY